MRKKNKINKVRQGIIAYEDRNPDFEIGFETPDASSYAHVVNEKNKKRTIIFSESQAENLRKYILLEDKRTKQAMNRSRQVIRERFNNEPWLDNVFNHQDNPKGLTYLEYMLEQFIEQFYHNPQMRAGQTMRLMPLFCKLAFGFNFQNNNPDAQKLDRLRSILNHLFVLSQKGEDLSKISLDMTFDELNNIYGTVIDAEAQAEKERMANAEYVRNEEYTVIGPVDYETAQKYGNESCPESKLCYTQSEKTWNDYTNNGLNNAYIILKDGWENIPPQHDDGLRSPYDEYGLSMIFVFVNPFGELAFCNTRWNHNATYPQDSYIDKAMSKEQISNLIGAHFNEVFKPNNSWTEKLSEVQERLSNGENPENIFDYVWPIGDGMYVVNFGKLHNYLTPDKKILRPDLWFDNAEEFDNGLALVNKNGLMNCIKLNGELISEEWFDYCGSWNEGWMVVTINQKYNFINQEGDFLFDEWLDGAIDFRRGMSCINKNGNLLVIDRNGEIVKTYNSGLSCKQDEDGNLRVSFFNNFNLIDEAGTILSPNMWFRKIDEFHEGYAVVYINGKGYNYINTEGNILSPDLWFDDTFEFRNEVGIVRLKDKGYNYINQEGEIIKPDLWFSRVYFFKDGFGLVEYEGVGCNYINNKGELLSPYLWFDDGGVFIGGYASVTVKEQDFYLKNDGKLYDKEGNMVNMSNLLHESVLKESPDSVETTNQDFDDVGACPFIMYKGFPEEVFIGPNGTTHDTLINYIYEEVDEGYGDYYKISDELRNAFLTRKLKVALRDSFELEGRYWNNEWGQMISVWEYDTKNYKDLGRKLNYVIKQLEKEGWGVDVNTLDFDDWKGSQASRYPFKWLLNGMAEIYMPEAIQIKKQGDNYVMYCKNGNILTINREGWVVKEPDYKMVESKKHKTIVISESQAENLRKHILLEDKRTKQAMNRARQVIRERFNNEPWLDNVFNHQDNPKGLTYLEYMLEQFIDEFYHNPQMRAGQTMRLMPLFCKLAFDFNFQNNNPDIAKLNRLRSILNHLFVISQKGEDLSKISLDTSFDELNNIYGSVIDAEAQAENERMANAEYVENKEYTVIGPVDFETAQKYGNKSCPESKLCYTQAEHTWNNYTSNGLNNAYIILKDGWENIPPQHAGEDRSPYDEYGLSMIFVFVDGEGDLVYCNTRWNHKADYSSPFSCDHAMSKEMISELIGRRFELVFKPNTVWRDKIAQIKERLSNGEDPHKLFDRVYDFYDGFARVILNNKYNFINTEGQFISDKWFDMAYDFYNGIARVQLDDKFNFINTKGQIISNQWFDWVDYFRNGFARVGLGNKYNLINTKGQIISNQWFDDCYNFDEGFAVVKLNGKSNFINTEGQIISDQWFDWVGNFYNGNARVSLDRNYNLINTEGQIISNQWFDWVGNFSEGFAQVRLNDKWNFINTKGQIIMDKWFDSVGNFYEGFAKVSLDFKYNFINTKGQIISNQWFDKVDEFRNGFAQVRLNDKWNFINTEGQIICNQWFDRVYDFYEGFAGVKLNGKSNLMNTEGQIISNQWFDRIFDFYSGIAKVEIGDKFNLMNTEGQIISDEWFDWVDDFHNGIAKVNLNSKFNFINTEGQIVCNQWFDKVYDFHEGFAVVELGDEYNFINIEGQIISDKWFDWVGNFSEGFAVVEIDFKYNFINTKGQFVSNQWFDGVANFRNGFAQVRLNNKYNLLNTEGQFMLDEWVDRSNIDFYRYKLTSATNEDRKHKTLIITEEQAKRLQRYLMEETKPEDVDLSSFKIQNKLNPKFWKKNKLNSKIRLKLLDIADDFVDSLDVNWVKPEDIIMTGSLANYTWNNEHSDIDLHILMDFKKVDDKIEFVRNYFKAKKDEWAEKHQELKIMGFPIEVYVQDKNEKHAASGIYSLEKNKWLKKPDRKNFSDNDYEDDVVKETVSEYMNQIDDIIEKFEKTEDMHQIEKIYDEANEIFDNIKNERKDAFKLSTKELSTGNVIFKTLRRNGYIEKIIDLRNKSYDKINSLC